MTTKHCGEESALWYRVFRYRWLERQIARRPDVRRILDLGCGSGENMWRFVQEGRTPVGIDVASDRLQRARAYGPVLQGEATALPLAGGSVDLVYAAHLLHHVGETAALLGEARRCLRRHGFLFLVETVEDHPLIRLGRRLHPRWRGDAVRARLYARQLVEAVDRAGFELIESGQYSVLFWIWELLPERVPSLGWLTPLFLGLELLLQPIAGWWAAHCYCVAVPASGEQRHESSDSGCIPPCVAGEPCRAGVKRNDR
jgi:ubiquinone/menaquinone biosynthesis C-methylase UbiE